MTVEVISIAERNDNMPAESAGVKNSVCLAHKTRTKMERAGALKSAEEIFRDAKNKETVYIDPRCRIPPGRNPGCNLRSSKSALKPKVLLFRNIFNAPGKEENRWFSPGALYLASGLKRAGLEVILSDSKISLKKGQFITEKDKLERILRENLDLGFIGISVCEGFFEQAERLIRFLRKRTKAFIGVGGVMPTLNPGHVFVHLPGIDFLVRGAGEEILPKIVKVLGGKNIDSPLFKEQIEVLLRLDGFVFRDNHIFISASLNKVNKISNYDRSWLDFGFVNGNNLTEGVNLFTSRGCFNSCFFCTSPGRGSYTGKSFRGLKSILVSYQSRLKDIFGRHIPATALRLSFNDDDFLADAQRARLFFTSLKKSPFRINFFQTGINSFFKRDRRGRQSTMNQALLDCLCPSIFSSGGMNIYIGTENFCDAELIRFNKGYGFSEIKQVAMVLSKKKIRQAHHLIMSNHLTEPKDIFDNLFKIAVLRALHGEYFSILAPIIPYLVSLYPSVSYKIALRNRRAKFLNIRRTLSTTNYPEYDYPLVENDVPLDSLTRELVPVIYDLFLHERDYIRILDKVLLHLLLLERQGSFNRKKIRPLIENYKDYPEMVFEKTRRKIKNDRNNLQLMITRRCQLRCRYCPIIKKNQDMPEEALYKAIDLLFTSSRECLRLDFTGGEPLLRFDLVEKAVGYAKKLARSRGKAISFYMVTNLIALTDKMADFLAKENFFLELSVDGREELHNLYKLSVSPGVNPYRLTTSQLRRIFTRKIDNYAVMVVSPADAGHLEENFCHLVKLGFRKIGLNYALGVSWEQKSRQEFFRQLDSIRARFFPYIARGIIKLSNLESRLEPAILNNEIMVNTDGRCYFLTDWLFEKSAAKKIRPLGDVRSFKNIDEIFLTNFRTLYRLLENYPSSRTREIIFNNIEMGNRAKDYFEKWKNR